MLKKISDFLYKNFYIIPFFLFGFMFHAVIECSHDLWHHKENKQALEALPPKALESCKDRCNHECSGEQVLDCLLACGRCEPHLCGDCDAHKELEALRPKVLESCASRCKNECPPAAWPSCLAGCKLGCHPSKCGNCNHL